MKEIGDYEVIEEVFANQQTRVYRAQSSSSKDFVIIKLSCSKYPSLLELASYRNHYLLTRNLNVPGVVRALKLETYGRGYALFLEDIGAVSLSRYLRQLDHQKLVNQLVIQNIERKSGIKHKYDKTKDSSLPLTAKTHFSLDIAQFFAIAFQLVDILEGLHHHHIIHRNIQPDNILINPEIGKISLTDFSIASRLPREVQALRSPNTLEGSLGYLSPEQTGRMNRGVDYRSDFYSLGISFFELLTGQLPFQSKDPMTLVHCHIAVQPPAVHTTNPEIPHPLSAIVAKLIAKNPEDRYQSTFGLRYDLQVCCDRYQERGHVESFRLGKYDVSDRFTIPEKLYGRRDEVKKLLAAFDRISQGTRELLLVAGHSGIGKTAVVNEIHKPIARQRGYFIRGKFEQFQRDVPLSGFVQVLNDLMTQVLSESSANIGAWRKEILAVLGENGRVILEVVPKLAQIIGSQPPVPELFGSAAQDRFNRLLKGFVYLFSRAEHPLVLFLDDLQWADSASLQFLQLLLEDAEEQHLLVVGAYRDNEVTSSHPLAIAIDRLHKNHGIAQTLMLGPLQYEDLNQLIADTLSCSLLLAAPLTKLVVQKTQGSPFFATQFLQSLYDRQLLSYNPAGGHWQFNISQVKSLSTTNDIVSLMVQRMQRLPQVTREVVSWAACLGNQFDLQTLSLICERSVWDTGKALWQALQEGLILPTSEIYRFFQDGGDTCDASTRADLPELNRKSAPQYRFLHDRVQQAAYSLIPTHQQSATHLAIGQRLLANLNPEARENQIFELVRHINLGCSSNTEAIAPERVADLNLAAAKRAKASVAYKSAALYCQTAQTHLTGDAWEHQYKLAFDTYFETLQVEFLLGHHAAAEELAQGLLPKLKTRIDSAKVHDFLVRFYSSQNRMGDAIEIGLQALQLLGIALAEDLPLEQVKELLPLPAIYRVDDLPQMTDPEQQMGLQILMNLCTPGYASDPVLYRRLVLTMLQLCQQHGYAAPSAHAFMSYGMALCSEAAEFDLGHHAGQISLRLIERFQAKELKVKANLLFNGQIYHWKYHLSETLAGLERGIGAGIEVQDLEFASYCINFLSLHASRTTDAIELTLTYLAKFFQLQHIKIYERGTPIYYARIWHQYLLVLAQVPKDASNFDPTQLVGTSFDETEALPQLQQMEARVSLGAFYLAKTILANTFDLHDRALEWAEVAANYVAGLSSTIVPIHNVHYSLALLATLAPDGRSSPQFSVRLERVDRYQQQLKQWADSAPMNYSHLYQLVEAERYRVLARPMEAMSAFDDAIALARTHGYIGDLALAYERAARFYSALGKPTIAQTYGVHAYYTYARWGARAKVEWLEVRATHLLEPVLHPPESMPHATAQLNNKHSLKRHAAVEQFDFKALMQASRLLSQEMQVDHLLTALLQVIRENSGAEKCVLMLIQDDRLTIKARALHRQCQLLARSVDSSKDVPQHLIHYAAHTQKAVLCNAADAEPRFAKDPYILQNQPQSILCSPILSQGKLLGLVYLENTLAAGVFTNERLETIELLCAQAAISLENAKLYEQGQLQQQELRKKNAALKRAIAETEIAKAEIVRLNHNLENRIQLRTAELKTTNQNLQHQIAERLQAQQQLKEREAQFASILNSLEEVVWSTSAQTGEVLYLNPAAEQIYGLPLVELWANPNIKTTAIHPEDREVVAEQYSRLLKDGELRVEYRIIKPNGEVSWLTDYSRVIYTRQHIPLRIDSTLSDITQRKQAEERLIHNAMHDHLTGLPNRASIVERLERALQRSKTEDKFQFALLFIDFDRFKLINDSLGHAVGDRLLVHCAQTISDAIPRKGTVARLGGDEFVILIEWLDDIEVAIQVAQTIQEQFQGEITIDSHPIFTSASIGIVLGSTHYTRASDLLQDADIAMYRAKANGRARYEVFTPTMRTQTLEFVQAGNDLRYALDHHQLCLHYQPIFSLSQQKIVGFEALIRWEHPERGLLLPDQFLPIAMESNLMPRLGYWALREACHQMGLWHKQYTRGNQLRISVNVSEKLISSPGFLACLEEILQEHELPPKLLCLELVESTLMSEQEEVSEILHQIRKRQIGLAIDDFGTGFSSLSYLHRFPIDRLKIDRSFVNQMNNNPESFEIIRTIIALAHTLEKTVIAEGIETSEQLLQLLDLGCNFGQGFFFSRPVPVSSVENLLQNE